MYSHECVVQNELRICLVRVGAYVVHKTARRMAVNSGAEMFGAVEIAPLENVVSRRSIGRESASDEPNEPTISIEHASRIENRSR